MIISYLSSKEEDTGSGRGEATIRQISTMVTGTNNRGLQLFEPDLSAPVTHRQEVSLIRDTSVQGVDRAQVSADIQAITGIDFDVFLGFLVRGNNDTLFSTHQELIGTSLGVEFKDGTSDISLLVINHFSQDQGVNGTFLELSGVPPEHAAISGRGNQFGTGLHGEPAQMGDRVTVGFLHGGDHGGLTGVALHVPNGDQTVVATTTDHIGGFRVVSDVGARGGTLEDQLGHVGVLEVPDVGKDGHLFGHLLEEVNSIGDSHLGGAVGAPRDLGDGTFEAVFRTIFGALIPDKLINN